MKAAEKRTGVILRHQNFSHQDPHEGIELTTVLPQLGYDYIYASENIGMGGLSTPDFVNGFMNSTSHRENLLNPLLTDTGAAIADGPYGKYYVNVAVQLFAIPGGRDERLGYTTEDMALYENNLAAVSAWLNPVSWFFGTITDAPAHTPETYRKLTRQREILETVLSQIRNEEPLTSGDVALILEFNGLL